MAERIPVACGDANAEKVTNQEVFATHNGVTRQLS
jgi:hypothetical protein